MQMILENGHVKEHYQSAAGCFYPTIPLSILKANLLSRETCSPFAGLTGRVLTAISDEVGKKDDSVSIYWYNNDASCF